ncbi:cupin domain-containing protein [Oryzobacter telluris]|uniref:cupin domain-containing protein n=1 Tax=Oryzobacter telluris TaxID=3149179 RepID=UPI00370D2498
MNPSADARSATPVAGPGAVPDALEPTTGAARPGRGLGAFVGVPRETFAREHWGRAPLLTRSQDLPAPTHGFGPAAVDELLSSRALRTPFLRMARDGATLPDAAFTLGGGVGAAIGDQVSEDKVLRQFAEGATIVLQALHRTWAPVARTARELAADLGHPVQVNAYVTPPQNRGFDDHYDVHDVLVVQVAGEKHWSVRPPVIEAPLRTQPWTDRREDVARAAGAGPVIDAVLRPGDCLYLPRGWLHSATALGGVSTHLTFGVHTWTVRHLLDDLLHAATTHLDDDPAARASLPLGVDVLDPMTPARHREAVRAALEAALDAVSDDDLARLLAARGRGAQRAEPLGVLDQHAAAERTHAHAWRVRDGLAARWEGDTLVTRVARVDVPPTARDAVRVVLAGDLDPARLHPDDLRRLVLAGVLLPADGGAGPAAPLP